MSRCSPNTDQRRRETVSSSSCPQVGSLLPSSGWTLAALAVLSVLLSVGAWFLTGSLTNERQAQFIDRERRQAQQSAESIADDMRRSLAYTRSIPRILSKEPALVPLLARFGPEAKPSPLPFAELNSRWLADTELSVLASHLEELIAEAGVNSLFVMNAAGDCIAEASFPKTASFTGVNYADREYFQAVREGRNGRQFAVGRVTGMPGLFFASPIAEQGRFLGAIAVRIDLVNFSGLLAEPDAFVTDENGVVILAHNPEILMHALPGAGITSVPEAEREGRYKRTTFETLDMSPFEFAGASGLVRWRGSTEPYVLGEMGSQSDLVRVFVPHKLAQMENFRQDHLWLFALLTLTSFLLVALVSGGVAYVRRNAQHRRVLMDINEQLARQASTDTLTGCANRRHFLAALDAERQRGARYETPFSLLSMDLDHFKDINDRFGHPGGDQALRHFVFTVQALLRPTDLLGRIGGEEFAILLPQTGAGEAAQAAERIRAAVEASPAGMYPTTIPLTVSIGVAQWEAGANETSESLFTRADTALYAAKAGGRDRVECWSVPEDIPS